MHLCSSCLAKIGITVQYPHMIKQVGWCDGCHSHKSSLDIMQVVEQALMIKGDKK